MNNPSFTTPKITKLRKAIVGFRDTQLIQIFQSALSFLHRYLGNALQFENDTQQGAYMNHSISLVKICLSFDFIGTSSDESSDDVCSIQIPIAWRSLIEESFIAILFQCYKLFSEPYKADVMECIGLAVSIRRSLFNDKERGKWLGTILQQTTALLSESIGLDQAKNYHELCKMLCKFKSTYQLSELSAREEFETKTSR
ncbi:Exportin 7 [Coelomomyces lativittatus]|nr:Exportin 7 [Coelomomyces lativittatus]